MRSSALLIFFSGLLGLVKAATVARGLTGCDVSRDVIPLPAGQTALTAPTDAKPIYIAVCIHPRHFSILVPI